MKTHQRSSQLRTPYLLLSLASSPLRLTPQLALAVGLSSRACQCSLLQDFGFCQGPRGCQRNHHLQKSILPISASVNRKKAYIDKKYPEGYSFIGKEGAMMTLGREIKKARIDKGWQQKELCEETGL